MTRAGLFRLLKPVLPRGLQIQLRRVYARSIRHRSAHLWPVDPACAQRPQGWSGWPDGKRFALVLTHDVETRRGYERVSRLAEIEKDLGFRSSFNFVPEGRRGRYVTSPQLINRLRDDGFEVGVHDWNHDGKLFSAERVFLERVASINAYLRRWNARGFRAGSMYHNLDWIRMLDVDYDLSTFDTDPFEPQPDGARTIFPFKLVRADGTCLAELPYTLAQDFTLFIVFREKGIGVWTTKLDWIVHNGGMALMNIHPDYLCFQGKPDRMDEYPIDLYRQFLTYCRETYPGLYWHALPGQVARFYLDLPAAKPGEASSDLCDPDSGS